jgi:branched-chain amino acid transport system substrate-binding protein
MAELGIAPTADTICVTNQIAVSSVQYWRNVPDGNYCAFNFQGAIPTQFNEIALDLNERYNSVFNDNIPSFAIASYDAVWVLALAIERAGTLDAAAIATEIELSDVELAQGRYYFLYGSQNPVPEGVENYMWHQWPDPAVTVLQYFEQGQDSFDSAIVWPPARQTHDTLYFTPPE